MFGEIWTLILWVRKVVECFKNCLMGNTSRSMEDSGADNNLNHAGLAKEVSEKKNFNM